MSARHDGGRAAQRKSQPESVATALNTHRYLRLSFVFAVGALLVGVIIASFSVGVKGSISYYYWTPARNVFVGVLIAASLAMLALNGRGGAATVRVFGRWDLNLPSPSTLLDFAAIFGPLIAIVPTDVKKIEQGLTMFTCEAEEKRCLPKVALPDVQNAVLTYICTVAGILIVMWFVRRTRQEKRQPFSRLVPVTAIVTAIALFLLTFVWNGAFPYVRLGGFSLSIHYIATLLFFAAFAMVVWIRGAREDDPEDRTPPTPRQRRWYKRLAVAMAIDILFLLGLTVLAWAGISDPIPGFPEVMVGEFAGLILFAWFWVIQTRQRWNEVVTPLPVEGSPAAKELGRRLTEV